MQVFNENLFPLYSPIALYLSIIILNQKKRSFLCGLLIFLSFILQFNNQVLPRLAGMFFKVGNLIRNFFDNNWARGKQNYSTTEQKGAKLFFSNTKVTYSKFQLTMPGDVFDQLLQYFYLSKTYFLFQTSEQSQPRKNYKLQQKLEVLQKFKYPPNFV